MATTPGDPSGYAGRTFFFRVDTGSVFRNTYSPDGTGLHFEQIEGPAPGTSEDVHLHVADVAPGVYFASWTEVSGMTVSHVMNLNNHTVHAFWTYPTPTGRVAELHTGTLQPLI